MAYILTNRLSRIKCCDTTTFTNPREVTIIFRVCYTGSINVRVGMYGLAVRNLNFINLLSTLLISVT